MKSSWRAAKSETMKPRNVSRLVRIARIMCGKRIGPGDSAVVALYIEISPHTGMWASAVGVVAVDRLREKVCHGTPHCFAARAYVPRHLFGLPPLLVAKL
jgi:hypothetical protein